jgi:hypothetical protein
MVTFLRNCSIQPVSEGKKKNGKSVGVNSESCMKILAIKVCKEKVQRGRS